MTSLPQESRIEATLGRAVEAWVSRAGRAAVPVVVASLLLAAAGAVLAARQLQVHSDIHSLVDERVHWMAMRRDFERSFPMVDDLLLLVVDAPTPHEATRTANVLARRLREERDVVHAAFVPGGGPFFERNALLYLRLDELYDLADLLATAQPFLAEVERERSLRSVFRLLGTAVEAVRDGEIPAADAAPLFERLADGLGALNQGQSPADVWQDLLSGEWGQQETTRQVVLVSAKLDLEAFQPAAAVVERVRQVVREERLERSGARARLTGDFVLTYEENEVLVGQAAAVGLASFVLVGLLLGVAMRSAWLIAATLVTLVAGLLVSLGWGVLGVGRLNPVSVIFPVLFIGLSADFGIHLCLRYRELRATGESHERALGRTGRDVGSSVVLCATTTAIGFFAFVPTEFTGFGELGWLAGPSMFIALLFSLTLLPALLSLAPPRVQAGWSRPQPPFPAFAPSLERPGWVRGAALLMALGSLALLPRAHFDPNQLHVRDPGTESVQAFEDLLASAKTSPWTLSALAETEREAAELAEAFRALEVVEHTVTPADLVPDDQEAKLEAIADIASFLPPPANGRAPAPGLHVQLASIHDFEAEAAALVATTEDVDLARRIRRLAAEAAALRARIELASDPAAELARTERVLLDPVDRRIGRVRQALAAQAFTLDDLPEEMRDQMIGVDGRLRVEVFPREDVGDPAALARFVDTAREVEPDVAGHAIYLLEISRSMVRSLQQALALATGIIALLLFVLWRRAGDTAVVIGILGLALVATTAVAVLAGIPFNFADVMALPLLLGLGVDSSIHLVHRFRTETGNGRRMLGSSTARAVTYSGLTTLASFGSLAFAPHRGMATIGQLLTLGVVLMLICNLVVLPALLPRARGDR
ncbi:MAG: MMPL family transporter [Myxococcota bacterium]|nr:MMPL family transporter [Myxococcota bacterium]